MQDILNIFKIKSRGNFLILLVITAFLANILYIYFGLNKLNEQYDKTNKILTSQSILKSVMSTGLLFNSSKGVVFSDFTNEKAKNTMSQVAKSFIVASEELKIRNAEIYAELKQEIEDFSMYSSELANSVKQSVITKESDKKSLALWRNVKLKIEPLIEKTDELAKIAMQSYKENSENLRFFFIVFSIVGAILLTIITILVMKIITESIYAVLEITQDLASGAGDLTKRLKISGDDELKEISEYFNKFIEKTRLLIVASKNLSAQNLNLSSELNSTLENVCLALKDETLYVSEIQTHCKEVTSNLDNSGKV